MFGRFHAVAVAPRSGAIAGLRSCLLFACVAGLAAAQDPAGTPNAGAPGAGAPATGSPATGQQVAGQQGQAQDALRYARIVPDKAQPFCWPSAVAQPPRFEDSLQKGDVVQVGRSEGNFVMVQLPLGPVGYVSKRFAAADATGKVLTKGSKVAFRYRPKASEAPVTQLEDGTELFVIGEQDDWWVARVPRVEAWLMQADVQIVDQTDPALATEYAAAKAKADAVVQGRLDAIATATRQREQNAADEAAVKLVADAFEGEMRKPVVEQDFAPLEEALGKVEGGLAEASSGRAAVTTLRQRIQTQKWIVEAVKLREEPVKPSTDPLPGQQPKDDLDRFKAIGWLRYESRIGGPGTFYLEKGGLRLYHVTCTTQRYDLSLFVDCEIAVQGPQRSPSGEAFSLLDAERVEVLGHNRN